MIKLLFDAKKCYNKLEETIIILLLVITTILIFYQVLMRYVFNNSPIWAEEIARFMFVWESWLGISLTQKYGRHIKIEILLNKLKNMKHSVILITADIFTMAICVSMVKYGWQVTELVFHLKQTSSGTGFPMWIVYSAVPVSCAMMLLRLIGSVTYEVKNILRIQREEEGIA